MPVGHFFVKGGLKCTKKKNIKKKEINIRMCKGDESILESIQLSAGAKESGQESEKIPTLWPQSIISYESKCK